MVAATRSKRPVNTIGATTHLPALAVEIFLDGEALGAITVPQEDFLSKNGNVLYRGIIKRGLKLPDGALTALSFTVNGVECTKSAADAASESGFHLSAPRKRADGTDIPNTGGEPMVTFSATVDAAEGEPYMILVVVKRLSPKAGKDQGHQLRVQGMPRAIGVSGPQVIGEVTGRLVIES